MKIKSILTSVFLGGAIIVFGCGGGNERTKVSPETLPDPESIVTSSDTQATGEISTESDPYARLPLELLTIHFDYDKYDLTPEALEILAVNAEALSNHPRAVIRIEGHCDERGTDEYNLALGQSRARAVRDYLMEYGIDPPAVSIITFGESRPADPGHNEQAWARNRRADFVVLSE
jgi:peptidoglycan-associated lipoprotein